MVGNIALPGMVTGVAEAHVLTHHAAPNVWWLCITDAGAPAAVTVRGLRPTTRPSQALSDMERAVRARGDGQPVNAIVAKLELDACGAWLTVANGSVDRPVVLRRAGWVDLRGHPGRPLGIAGYEPADDRVGLGPADTLVLRLGPQGSSESGDELIASCIRLTDAAPVVVAQEVRQQLGGQVVAIGVPADLGDNPLERVASATGVPVNEVQSPGYPLGDLQPDLWRQPPRPPRLAQLLLPADRRSVAGVRSLLDRLLGSWRLDGRLDPDDIKLIATELAANAVVHGKEPETVTVRYLGDVVRVEVIDRSRLEPVAAASTADSLGGRGMHLVEALGTAWGSEPTAEGKRVWCDLAVAPTH